MNQELIIYSDKNTYKRISFVAFAWTSIALFLFFYTRHSLSAAYFSLFLQIILGLIFTIALISCFYSLYRIARTTPMAIINSKGIWVKQFGIIPWHNIQKVDKCYVMNMPVEKAVGIKVHDTGSLSKQATIAGKMIIFESKILKCPTIVFDNIELETETIIIFANQFMQNKQ